MSPLRSALAIIILAVLGLALAAPWALTESPLLLSVLSASLGKICHQEPGRTLLIEGMPSLLCARCLGALAGGFAALFIPKRLSKNEALTLLALGAATWLAEASLRPWPAEARLLAGTTIGLALVAPLTEAYKPQVLC